LLDEIEQSDLATKSVEAHNGGCEETAPINGHRSKLKDNLAFAALGYGIVSAGDIVLSKLLFSQQRLQLMLLRELCCRPFVSP
jgi:hypothetical protein